MDRDTVTFVQDWTTHVSERASLFSVFVQRLIPSCDRDGRDVPYLVERMQDSCMRLQRSMRVVDSLTVAMLKPIREAETSLLFSTIASLRETIPEMLATHNARVLAMRSWCLPYERVVFVQEDIRKYCDKLDKLEAILFTMQRRF